MSRLIAACSGIIAVLFTTSVWAQFGQSAQFPWRNYIAQCQAIPANNPSKNACINSICGNVSNAAERSACMNAGAAGGAAPWQSRIGQCRSITNPQSNAACVNSTCGPIANPAEKQACVSQGTYSPPALQQINTIRGQVGTLRNQARALCGQIPDAIQRAACLKEFS